MNFGDRSIRDKLLRLNMAATGAALILSCAAFLTYEFVRFRDSGIRQIKTLGEVTAFNSTAALAFENPGDATQILSALGRTSNIEGAALYNLDGELFATFIREPSVVPIPSSPPPDGFSFSPNQLVGTLPVLEGQRRIGTLFLQADVAAMHQRFRRYSQIAAAVLAVSLLLAFFLTRTLQKQISDPLLSLTNAAKGIASAESCSVRLVKQSDDELGLLTDAFNEMSKRVEERERFFRISLDLLCIVSNDGYFRNVNPAFLRTLGFTEDELRQRPILEFVHPEDRPASLDATQRLTKGELLVNFENRLQCKDGSYRWFMWTSIPFPTEGVRYAAGRDITERKAAERTLAERARLLDLSSDAIIVRDLHNRITYWNRGAENILGWSNEEALGRDVHELLHTGLEAPLDQLVAQLRSENHLLGEVVQTARDGRRVRFLCRWSLDWDHEGNPKSVLSTGTDITDRNRTEEAAQRLAAIVESSQDAILSVDLDGVITSWNAGAERLFGYTAVETVGQPLSLLYPPGETDETSPVGHCIREGKPLENFQTVRRHRNGRLVDVSITVSPLMDRSGRVIGASTIKRDVSDRRRIEESLRDSEQRFRALVTATSDVLYRLTPDWGEMLDLNGGDFLADTKTPSRSWLHDYIFPEDQPRVMAAIDDAIRTQSIFELEHRVRRTDGSVGWTFSRAVPLLDAQGGLVEWFGAAADITDRKLAETRIQEANQQLEHRVAERTAQLEAANQELESFSYSISHDLRAPLRGIDSFARMLQEDYAEKLDAEGKRWLTIVSDEAKRMGRLIDELLSFSRLGRRALSRSSINMDRLARDVAASASATTPVPNKPRFDIGPLPPVHGDYTLIRQVLINLVSNAVKYAGKQDVPTVEISGHIRDDDTLYAVKDNGVGFDEKYAGKLFGVFQRLHSEDEFEGTGVGLAIVQRIVHRHGGKVWAESKLGYGATFYFTLPHHPNS
jgi:PAS domain S-box-containing protein